MTGWQFWIDRGGTFTDLVARDPDGQLHTAKLLSEHPERYRDAALQGIRDFLGLAPDATIPATAIDAVKMGTTVATNALLERKGTRTLFAVTQGFADVLAIATQHRPELFALHIQKPSMLYARTVEIQARISADGEVLQDLDDATARKQLQAAFDAGFRAIAIALMHAYRYPDHERRLAAIARDIGFEQVSVSHEVSVLIKLIARGDTTVADAYLSPILRRYVDQVARALGDVRLMFMQSNGGLTDAHRFRGKDSILSGPAGGIVGAVKVCEAAGYDQIITFDMGGTSTDVAHYNGRLERTFDRVVAGTRIQAPMMDIHTVAAGGGSVVAFDGARFTVGPDSAGADPGPTCYGRGGPLTVTDCNLLLGRLVPDFFPQVFGPEGNQPLDEAATRQGFDQLANSIESARGERPDSRDVATGCLAIAVQNMARAIKTISVQRGYDVADYTLCCFGGAGGQLACQVADVLGMTRILVHPLGGVLSAYGMGLADLRTMREQSIERDLTTSGDHLHDVQQRLQTDTRTTLQRQGADQVDFRTHVQIKYQGTDKALDVPYATVQDMATAFHALHRERFGFAMTDVPLVAAAVTVEAIGRIGTDLPQDRDHAIKETPPRAGTAQLYLAGEQVAAPIIRWGEAGFQVEGPAIVLNDHNTVVVEPGWRAQAAGTLILERVEARRAVQMDHGKPDPVMLEIFNNLFMSIAEQMGYTLANTASSVNMKERLDFSCALFDRHGHLVANAPHMPVHLGSMGEALRALIREHGPHLAPGDVYASNNPFKGGTHLPDITVMTPVFNEAGDLCFFTAARGHHADIGGITPGSMPPFSRTIDEEGALLDNVRIVSDGQFQDQVVRDLFRKGSHPSRNLAQNIADLKAQIAATHKGVQELRKMIDHYSQPVVDAYMRHVRDYAETAVRKVIGVLRSGSFRYDMDNGAVVAVQIDVDREAQRARIDFSGTSPQQDNNFNAPVAIVRAAVLYVFRTLVREDIPLNDGCLVPLDIHIPDGCMLKPSHPAAVVAGNVETSQVVTDALYGALGVMAAAQGTMNNLTFGNDHHQYYETVGGGAGAGPDFPGADAVHTHMTNSRLTDPEVLEWRYPVILNRFAIRRGSGGKGQQTGGDGIVRELRFREAMTAAILSNRRKVPPFGMAGGAPGALGENRIRRSDGSEEVLSHAAEFQVNPGDVFCLHTPGGGGYGKPDEDT